LKVLHPAGPKAQEKIAAKFNDGAAAMETMLQLSCSYG